MKKKRRIGILIDRLNVGGVEKIAIEEVKALLDLDQDATLVVLRRKGVVDNAFVFQRRNIPVVYLDDRIPKILKFSFKFPVFNFFSLFHVTYPFIIPFVVKKNEFDFLIVHGTYTAFTAIAIKKIKKIKFSTFIWDPIGYIIERVYSKQLFLVLNIFKIVSRLLDKVIINNSDVILVGGSAHNKYLKELEPTIKIVKIYPSTTPLAKITNKKSNYVLMVTAWKKGKNPEYIFELVNKIPKLKIKMAGKWLDNSYKEEFIRNLKKNHLQDNIDVIGEVTEAELVNLYSNANFLLQTNDDRGFGMPALEAAGCGTTFIIPKGQGVCELFVENIHGFYTKENDTSEIKKNINKLMNDKVLSHKMGLAAWSLVKDNYTWKEHAKILVDNIYK